MSSAALRVQSLSVAEGTGEGYKHPAAAKSRAATGRDLVDGGSSPSGRSPREQLALAGAQCEVTYATGLWTSSRDARVGRPPARRERALKRANRGALPARSNLRASRSGHSGREGPVDPRTVGPSRSLPIRSRVAYRIGRPGGWIEELMHPRPQQIQAGFPSSGVIVHTTHRNRSACRHQLGRASGK